MVYLIKYLIILLTKYLSNYLINLNPSYQDKPEYFANHGTVVFVKKDNCMYQACPSNDCNKKVNH